MSMQKPKNDRALRFYNEVLGLDHLHYGIWNADDELTINNLKRAQQRYEDLVVNTIPENSKILLDVGCGTGELSKRLLSENYSVEGLSPDVNQKDLYAIKTNGRPFHFCRFEDFESEQQFDCIIMSESGQYIPLKKLFATAVKTLKKGGYLISIDYFVLNNITGALAKSGHNHDQFCEEAKNNGFKLIKEEDITGRVTKTLDFSKQLVEKGLLALDIGTEKYRYKHPYITRFINWLLRKKKQSFKEQMLLLDSEKFSAAKCYKLFLFKRAE